MFGSICGVDLRSGLKLEGCWCNYHSYGALFCCLG
ncbi:hypothetical protein OROGR_024165 [Orobanche gracilis]